MQTRLWSIRRLFIVLVVVCFAFMGCEGEDNGDTSDDSDTETDTGSDIVCEELSADDCILEQSCTSVMGNRIDYENECMEAAAEFLGCVTPDTSTCNDDDELGYAVEPETGDCYIFSSPCYPDGWSDSSTSPQDFEACDVPGSGDDEWFWDICS